MIEDRLIRASDAKRAIEHADPAFSYIIDNVPTADAAEVVHSKWILNDDGSGTCRNCHRTSLYVWDMDNWLNYCPNCGADMRGN